MLQIFALRYFSFDFLHLYFTTRFTKVFTQSSLHFVLVVESLVPIVVRNIFFKEDTLAYGLKIPKPNPTK